MRLSLEVEEGCILDYTTDVRVLKDVMYRLDEARAKVLLEEPESGMGYQSRMSFANSLVKVSRMK